MDDTTMAHAGETTTEDGARRFSPEQRSAIKLLARGLHRLDQISGEPTGSAENAGAMSEADRKEYMRKATRLFTMLGKNGMTMSLDEIRRGPKS